jgi:ribosome-associated heat shock protein Hsp15
MRIDKWLWAVRVFRTRSLAADACRTGGVTIVGQPVKPSRNVRVDDLIMARTGDLTRTVKVLAVLSQRVGAPLVPRYALDLTPASEYEKRTDSALQPLFHRPKGLGRPTKKDRRSLGGLSGKM